MQMTPTRVVVPRSLQEWMEREGVSAAKLLRMVREQTGVVISRAMFSYILCGSRRCSRMNALALWDVTGVPMDVLTRWPKHAESDKVSIRRPKRVA